MQLQRCVSAVKNVKAVIALGALKHIPEPRELYGLTYFSIHDIWLYQEVSDHKTCELCRRYAEHEDYHGNRLRMLFPYLEILDEYTIAANVHPNCRCVLVRYIGEPEEEPKPKEPKLDPEVFKITRCSQQTNKWRVKEYHKDMKGDFTVEYFGVRGEPYPLETVLGILQGLLQANVGWYKFEINEICD